ncbi:hypothetical protein NFO65_18520 [Neorhizobium galegae]|uniref:hypothetical protein n=1 Tax=Neorhizobium galegae TaxID=399 RepID=UPI0021011F91|nr:hypothetical protein [Neorhizobium galegae]MCQ1572727.1 hypothetical protein [Neorhizobium galegae]
MSDEKKDALDNLIEFILSNDTPIGPEDEEDLRIFSDTLAKAETALAKARLERARAGVFSHGMAANTNKPDIEGAKRLLERAKARDATAGVTLAARFGDGSMDGDLDAVLEDLAELLNEDDDDAAN